MKAHRVLAALVALAFLIFPPISSAQTPADSQARAIEKYPELQQAGSEMNKRFVEEHNRRRKLSPEFFQNPNWPMLLADDVASPMPVAPQPPIEPMRAVPVTPSTTPPNEPAATPISTPRPMHATPRPIQTTTARASKEGVEGAAGSLMIWGGAAAVIALLFWGVIASSRAQERARAERLANLTSRFGERIALLIIRKSYWQGQTEEQLLESLGRPADIDSKVLKTKSKDVWKYFQTGHNRFGLRITVENGIVVGWDEKI